MNTNIVLDPPPDVDHFPPSDSGSEEEDSDSDESLASLESDSEVHPPEKILFESPARNQHIWYLVKWKDCPLLRSSWEGKDCFEEHPGILEAWVIEKERQKEGKSKPFDVDAFKKACNPSPSPSADTELICPTEDSAECYPRLFQPTKDFQTIKPGQDIPPGLHVRLNISSGLKEARLNVPMEDEEDVQAIEISTEQGMVAIQDVEEKPVDEPQPPPDAPAYEAHGKVQPPPPSSTDFETFKNSLISLKKLDTSLQSALSELSELSHDIYYGSEIIADREALSNLICLMALDSAQPGEGDDHAASAILSNSLQNNPKAISSLTDSKDRVMNPKCKGVSSIDELIPLLHLKLSSASPSTLKSQVSALNGLIKSPAVQSSFLEQNGPSYLQAIFMMSGSEYDVVRKRIVQLLMDNFLDESMGAKMGVWPSKDTIQHGDKQCSEGVRNDSCWAWYGKEFSATNGGNKEWMKEFLDKIGEVGGSVERDEL
ncbi:nucleotide exchange factor SIL1 protein [Rutstroemia sp. NJR-2017a BBW]|nr:nucleotide exchange factor SIL1 protein [Rutstroemia sp. NJR-2017a BBW]